MEWITTGVYLAWTGCTFVYVRLAQQSFKARRATTLISVDPIQTGSAVGARGRCTFVDVRLAVHARVAGHARALIRIQTVRARTAVLTGQTKAEEIGGGGGGEVRSAQIRTRNSKANMDVDVTLRTLRIR
jgi:hypothetical protein